MRSKMRFRAAGMVMLAAAVSILPSCSPNNRQAHPSPVPQSSPQAARQEANYKEKTVKQDIQATEKLIREQSARDARIFLAQMSAPAAKSADMNRSVRSFLKKHPELAAARWVGGDAGTAHRWEGAWPKGLKESDRPEIKKAVSSVRSGKSYSSPLFNLHEKPFFVFGEPSSARKGEGLVVLVPSSVVNEVEKHQRKNMRLVPFPAEGRYWIESVKPGTTQDITVRKGEDNQNASHYVVNEIVVKFRRGLSNRELLQIRKELDVQVVRQNGITYVFRSKTHRMESMRDYFKKWNPVYTEPHYLYLTNEWDGNGSQAQAIVPNDTLYSEYQWNLPQIAAEQGWNLNKGSEDIVVAVVDTGVQSDHPDLQGRLVEGLNVIDPASPPEDDVGHGTHVAGIIAAQVNNQEGVAGITWYTKIMPIKVLDNTGAGSAYAVAEGVIWAADHGAHVINMSLGNYAQAQFLHDAIQYAVNKGVVVVAASGNDNTDRPGYPAAYPEVIAVSATDPGGGKAEYSNYGDYMDVAAPGTSIASTYPGSRYAALSGTSMASPHVAALASLVRAANPQLTPAEVADVLCSTAKDLGDKGRDAIYGYGEIDVRNALQAVGVQMPSLQLFPAQVRQQLNRIGSR